MGATTLAVRSRMEKLGEKPISGSRHHEHVAWLQREEVGARDGLKMSDQPLERNKTNDDASIGTQALSGVRLKYRDSAQ